MTHEEVKQVQKFVSRDLYNVGHYLAVGGSDWLRLKNMLLKKEALSRLSSLSDQLKIEFKHLKN